MSDIKLFAIDGGTAAEIPGSAVALEKSLQTLIERNLEVHPGKGCVTAYVKVDAASVTLEPGFTRDVAEIGHFGTGDLEITLRSRKDLETAKPLFQRSYEAS